MFPSVTLALLCTIAVAAPSPKAPKYDKVIQIRPLAGPFAGGDNFFVSSVYDQQGGLGVTTGKTLAAHFSYQVVGESRDGLRLGNLLAGNLAYNGTAAPNMVIAGRTLAGGNASPVNQPRQVGSGDSFVVAENGQGPSESAVFSVDPKTKSISVISTVQEDFEVFYGACLRFSGQTPQANESLPINEIQFYSRVQECRGEYTYVQLTLVSRK